MTMWESPDLPPDLHQEFLESVLNFERAPMTTYADQLTREGLRLPPPEELDDQQIKPALWALIERLAARHVFLHSTDHLSDRELYTHLWRDALNESVPDVPVSDAMSFHIDLVSSGSEEDIQLWMRYYADEQSRQHWLRDFPDYQMPPHEEPPFDRDRRLPQVRNDQEPPPLMGVN